MSQPTTSNRTFIKADFFKIQVSLSFFYLYEILGEILSTLDDCDYGYILECD